MGRGGNGRERKKTGGQAHKEEESKRTGDWGI